MWNPISDLKALQENSVEFFLFRVLLFDALKRTLKIFPKRLLSKGIKKRRLKFNPGLALIGLRTTGPWKSVCIFWRMFSIHFPRCWQREFVEKPRSSVAGDPFLYSYDLNGWFRGNTVRRNQGVKLRLIQAPMRLNFSLWRPEILKISCQIGNKNVSS